MPTYLPAMSVRLLGTPEVLIAESKQPHGLSRPALTLLARLLQRRGAIVSRTELADALWPNLDDLTARENNLRQHLAALRRTLGERLVEEGRRGNQTVMLARPDLTVDIYRFEDALEAGHWQDAVELYRGELLPGVALGWVEEWRDTLRRKLREALFALSEGATQRSDPEAAQQYLTRARELDPFDEEALRRQMALLAEQEQTITALSLYERYVQLLRRELPGQPPRPETVQLFGNLRRRGDSGSGPGTLWVAGPGSEGKVAGGGTSSLNPQPFPSRTPDPPPRGYPARTLNLPASLTSLIGRETLSRDVLRSLQTTRLVSLVGTGGIGKTRLALEVGRLWEAEGSTVCLVEFARVGSEMVGGQWSVVGARGNMRGEQNSSPNTQYPIPNTSPTDQRPPTTDHLSLLEQAVAEAVGLPDAPVATRRQQLQDCFRASEVLLLWDNCEHIRDSARELARILLTTCPRLRILVTSREPLGLASERIISAPPLTVPAVTDAESLRQSESGRLFLERIGRDAGNFTPAEVADLVILCQRLEGIPLALELAASALVRFGSPGALVADLSGFMRDSGAVVDEQGRRRSLPDTIAWSDHLLTPDERRLFYRMGLLVGGGDRDAIVALAESAQGTHWQQELVYKSLAVVEPDAYGVRVRLLEPIREYALRRLAETNDREAATRCHALWFADWVTARNREMRQVGQAEWLRRLNRERPNIEAAIAAFLSLGESERAAELVLLLWRFWQTRGWWQEGAAFFEQVLDRVRAPGSGVRGPGVEGKPMGVLGVSAFDTPLSSSDPGPPTPEPESNIFPTLLLHSGMLLGNGPDSAATEKRLGECIALCQEGKGDDAEIREIQGQALNALGMQALRRGDMARSSAYYEAALPLWTSGGAALNTNLGINALEQGEYAESIARFEAALAIRQQLKETIGEAAVWNCLGAAHLECGNLEKGRDACQHSLDRYTALEDRFSAALARINLGEIALLSDNLTEASTHLDSALNDLRTAADAEALAECQVRRAEVAIEGRNLPDARECLIESLHLCRRNNLYKTTCRLLETLASLASQEGEPRRAVEYLHEAERQRSTQAVRRSPLREQRLAALWHTLQTEPKDTEALPKGDTVLHSAEDYLTTR